MKNLWQRLLKDETGVILSSELALVGTVGVLGMVVGLESFSTAVTQELTDLSNAFGSLNQSFSVRSISKGRHARVSGSCFNNLGVGANNVGLNLTDVCGQGGGAASSQVFGGNSTQVFGGNSTQMLGGNSTQVLSGQVLEQRVIEEVFEAPVTVRAAETVCPDDEIIEEHVIRRRVKANSVILDADCARSSQNNAAKIRLTPDNSVNSIPNSKLPLDKVETKKPKK